MRSYLAIFLPILLSFVCLPLRAEVEILPLPDCVEYVHPEQGRVLLVGKEGNVSPFGVTQIELHFFDGRNLQLNPERQGYFELFLDGDDHPADQLPVSEASIDPYAPGDAQFMFDHDWMDPGTYHITIPEGVWLVAGIPTPAFALNYEITRSYMLDPVPGVVGNLESVALTFIDASKIERGDGAIGMVFEHQDLGVDLAISGNVATLSFTAPDGKAPHEAGNYRLTVETGAFNLTVGSEQLASDQIRVDYQLAAFPRPSITPAEGTITGFKEFLLTMPDDFTLTGINDHAGARVFPCLENGEPGADQVCRLWPRQEGNDVVLFVVDEEGNALEEEVRPEGGQYVLQIIDDSFYGQYGDVFVSSPRFNYYYKIPDDPTKIIATPYDHQTLESLESIELYFPNATTLKLNDGCTEVPVVEGFEAETEVSVADCTASVTLLPALTEEGEVTVTIPATLFLADGIPTPAYTLSYHLLGVPDDPEDPDEPDDPSEPSEPDNPDDPEDPSEPDEPDEPSEPDEPEEPDDAVSYTLSDILFDVITPNGVLIFRQCERGQINLLPAGIYIINGRATLILP